MSKVISGTKAAKQVRVKKATGSIKKIRCTRCGTMVNPSPDGRGGNTKMQCMSCGAQYSVRSL